MHPVRREQVVAEVAGRIPRRGDHRVLVAVDGVDGAGKSMFAAELASRLRASGRPVIEASVDGFHRPREARYRRGRDSAEGFWLDSFDYPALGDSLLGPLGPGGSGRYRTAVHDVATDGVLDLPWFVAEPGAVLVFDGLFLHRAELRAAWDFSVFLDVPFAVSARRLADRDGSMPDPAHPSLARYVEAQKLYFADSSPMTRASIVIDNSDLAAPVIR